MAHKCAPGAESDLDDIWYYVANDSGSVERADRFVASLTERFYLLSKNPCIGCSRDDFRPLDLQSGKIPRRDAHRLSRRVHVPVNSAQT